MTGQLPRVLLLGAVLLLVLAAQPQPAKGQDCPDFAVSGVDLCNEFENATKCRCDIILLCEQVHITCGSNSTYSGDIPDFSRLERHNYSVLLTIDGKYLPTFNITLLDSHPQLELVELQNNGLREFVGFLPRPRRMQTLTIKDNQLSSIGDLVLKGLAVTKLDLTNNSFTAVPTAALESMEDVDSLFLSHNPLVNLSRNAFKKTIRHLSLSYCGISNIAAGAFHGMKEMSSLALDNNELTRIEAYHFTDLARNGTPEFNSLKSLTLDYNKIAHIAPGSFRFSQLTTLDIHQNSLTVLQEGVLTSHLNLDRLDFSFNALVDIEEGALDGVYVAEGEVDFSYNQLTRVEAHYFQGLTFETHDNSNPTLDLSNNMIEYIAPEAFADFHGLTRLRLHFNRLRNVTGVLLEQSLESLKIVELENNLLTWIPNASLPNLQKWDLERNFIRQVGANDLKPYPGLLTLHLSNNTELASFHEDALTHVPYLELVECDHCRLSTLPNFNHSTKLAEFTFNHNQITDVPDDLCVGKKSLAEIGLSFNRLTRFPNVRQCSSMDGMTVAGNMIESIPDDALDGLENLRLFFIDYNQISELPPNLLKGHSCFRTFSAGHNQISRIPDGFFDEAENMEDLNLESNRLTYLQKDVFRNLTYLHKLLLSHNQIEEIHEQAWQNGTFHFLTHLELSYNPLARLPAPGEGFPHLQVLYLEGCPNLWVVPPRNATKRIERVHYTYPYHCCLWANEVPPDWRNPDLIDYDYINRFNVDSYTVATTPPPTQAPSTLPTDFPLPPLPGFPSSPGAFDEEDLKKFIDNLYLNGGNTNDPVNISISINGDVDLVVNCGQKIHPTSNLDDTRCFPRYNEFTPCEDLLGSWALRVLVWAVVILALTGNAAVLFVMVASKKTMDTPQFLISNLAFADLLLGIYLTFISVVDLQTHESQSFYLSAVSWQLGAGCKTAGFLAIFSTELSVYLLVIITFERLYTFTYAMQNKRLELRPAIVLVVIGWVSSFAIAILPILPIGVNSYSSVAVCLPFEVDSIADKLYIGGLVIVNLVGLILVVAFYMRIYCVLRRSSAANSNSADRKLIRSILLLTVVDFLCWAPLSILTLSAIFDFDIINTSVSKWFVVLVFPINACCNPFLYAIFTKKFRQRVQQTLCCATKQSALQRQLRPGQSTQRLSARRTSISIAEFHRRTSSGSTEYSQPYRGRLNSTQPLLHQLSSSGAPSSVLSSSDRTSITSIGSATLPIGLYGRRLSLPSTLVGPHPLEQAREGQCQSLCTSPIKGITPELYQRMLPSLAQTPNCTGSMPNLPEGCNHEFESPLPHTAARFDGSPNLLLYAIPPHRTISPGDYHVTNLATVQEASNENLQSQPSASLDSNPWGSSTVEPEPLSFEEMKPLSKSVFDALHASQSCSDGETLCSVTSQETLKSSTQSVGRRSGEEERKGDVRVSVERSSYSSRADSASDGGTSIKSLEEFSESPWTPVRKQAANQGRSSKSPRCQDGTAQGRAAGHQFTVVAVNPRFQSEVTGSETEV